MHDLLPECAFRWTKRLLLITSVMVFNAWADGYHIWLGTLEGARIALEPALFSKLNNFRDRMIAGQKVPQK